MGRGAWNGTGGRGVPNKAADRLAGISTAVNDRVVTVGVSHPPQPPVAMPPRGPGCSRRNRADHVVRHAAERTVSHDTGNEPRPATGAHAPGNSHHAGG